MPAEVFQVLVQGKDSDRAHIHVVLIDIDSAQRLCIPAYDTNGPAANHFVERLHSLGIYQGTGWVELDNTKAISFHGSWTGKPAKWIPYNLRRIEKRQLGECIGIMSDAALATILECLIKLHAGRPGSTLADDELKPIRRLAKVHQIKLPPGF